MTEILLRANRVSYGEFFVGYKSTITTTLLTI